MVISTKRLAQLAKKWQRMVAMGRRRITRTMAAKRATEECCEATSVAVMGHCVVYTVDGCRFEVPLAYLGNTVFVELLRMSEEEFGFTAGNQGRITLPCDAAIMEYAMCLLRRDASTELVKAFLGSIAKPCRFEGAAVAPCIGLSQHVAVC